MPKILWKPGTMLYPLPVVLVTSAWQDRINVLTVAWTGTVNSEPPMLSVSIRPERFSYEMIKKSGEFAVNLPGANLASAVDFCGVKSGSDIDKFAAMDLHPEPASVVKAPLIRECPVAIEARIKFMKELGSHHMFVAEVVAVKADKRLMDSKGRFHLEKAGLLCYNHGYYCTVSRPIGKFGFSVMKKKKGKGHANNPLQRRKR